MKAYSTEQLRTIVCVGPPGAGKTSLVEAILHRTGSIPHKGRIEDGSTVGDRTPEEIHHGYSIDSTAVATEYENFKINLIDTPGSSEFLATTALAMEAADAALVVIDAQTVSNPELLLIWNLLNLHQLPRLIFVNKCERDPDTFTKTVSLLHETLGEHIDPLELPLPDSNGLSGVIDLISNRGFIEHGSTESEIGIPTDLVEQEQTARDILLDEIVQEDDSIMERYLSGEELAPQELLQALATGVQALHLTPLTCGSALDDVGMQHLLEALVTLAPTPTPDPDLGWCTLVISATQDQYLGRLTVLKNLGATLHPDDVLETLDGHEERLHQLLVPTPSELTPVAAVDTGDLVVVPKLTAPVGTLLTRGARASELHSLHQLPAPGFTIALTTDAPQDEERLATSLFRAANDDPGIRIDREPGTHRLLVQGFGTNHLAITIERIRRRGQIKVHTHEPITQYRETFRASAQAEGRYKKQTGGHGQFGVATIVVEPLPRDSGFEFIDEIVGGAIPRNFIPAVEKGIVEAMETGGLLGYPITDIRVRLIDGKYHSVDSSEMSFKMAGSLALREALGQAQSQLLEPILRLSVTTPVANQGDVLGYLSSKRGKILHTSSPDSSWVTIEADAPAAEIGSFAPDLRAMTNGLGSFVSQPHHYDAVPDHIVDKLSVSKT
ncbi:elongation factor G [Ferrimicrobium sp.]|uniref:elongation factor G n=1 Tax=Ferrimicrobium sp. TaxID=2926050 RepID=UPI002635ABB1|nr:elongation factor G [Ferrimicrobium sp.]